MAIDTRTINTETSSIRGFLDAPLSVTVAAFKTWIERIEARRDLAELTPREIADIGLEPEELAREIAKPFWRA